MKGWVWVAFLLVLAGVVVGVRYYTAALAEKNVTVMDASSFNRELYQATTRHEDWASYPQAVARRFVAKQCECTEHTVEPQPLGTDHIFRVSVSHPEVMHKMRGHVYRLEIMSAGGGLKITKATREWLPWSRESSRESPEP